ncbi:MAG: MBL fold metallo-hydrolase [Burkholderiaceae bacterium]|jgi:glyoxylase-like metal-dependent hydrolase (beta-lactamase superfamily II)/8-oxo-dGTP pyrophosphatase MutT (NUDIX family)|nr:MBL fold metallo-hydrolase [Burkholderiaceae bacterium]
MTATVRPEKRLHPWQEPVAARPAATILLLRDSGDGPQVLMTRRSNSASFAPGAYVFPGGTLDARDASPLARELALARPDQDDEILSFATAAVREAFEELGILLARGRADGTALAQIARSLDRSRNADLFAQVAAHELRLALDEVHWFSHWITDRDLPKRFDVRFFVARMPAHQQPVADEGEQFEPTWVTPAEGLARHEEGRFNIIFPTIRTLRRLTRFGSVDEVLAHASGQSRVSVSCPRGGWLRGRIERFSEEELPFGELELVTPDGGLHHSLDWQSERVVPLLRHVHRLTAPNPGRMTGPGTNTYIVGTPGDWLVVDPGPDDAEHIDRIAAFVGDGLKTIVCTHAHPDHAPGAAPLQRLTGARIVGRPSGPHFNPAWTFRPDETLEDGARLKVGDSTLRALHTPGHAEHHVCLLLEEDGLLFSGDHILNGSTTVVDPPDGDMRAYVASLQRLAAEPFEFILPAHGHVIARAKTEIARLIAHRMAREAKVVDALDRLGGGTLDELVVLAYDDVDPLLHPVARRSLTAHLLKLRDERRATLDDRSSRWKPA